MPERTVSVSLIAQTTNYIRNMELAANSTKRLGATAAESAALSAESSKKIGTAFLSIGTIAAVSVALAIKEFADFDAKMSQVQTLSHATASDMAALTQAALTAGQKIGFSANEVADAEIEMVKAGISVKDILGGALPGALQLAAAGQIDVADATEIATIAMTQFGLKGKDIPHVADLLSAGADKALGGVSDLGYALKSGGLVASSFGISLDDTIGTLSAFANAGLIGETAGTTFRQMLLQLAKPSQESAAAMKSLGIEVYNSQDKFVGLDGLAGELQEKLKGLTQAQQKSTLATIFGTHAINGANVLMAEGKKGIDDWNNAVDDQGFAASQASGKMNNLEGDLKKLGAAFQSSVIQAGSGANSTLRDLTQDATAFVGVIGNLPAPLLQTGLQIGTVVAGTGLLIGGFLRAVPAIKSAQVTLRGLGVSAGAARTAVGATALAMTGLVIAVTLVAQANAKAQADTETYTTLLNQQTGALTKSSKAFTVQQLAMEQTAFGLASLGGSAYDFADRFGISADTVTKAAEGNTKALAEFHDQINAAQGNPQYIVDPTYGIQLASLASAVQGEADKSKNATAQIQQKNAAERQQALDAKTSTAANNDAAAALGSVSAAAGDASGAISELATQIAAEGKAELDLRSARRDYEQSIDDATAAVKKNGETLDINTQKGRDNQAALDSIAAKATAVSAAIVTQTNNQKDATSAIASGRAAYIKAAESMGRTASQANDLADAVGLIPTTVTLQFKANNIKTVAADVDALRKALGLLGQLETAAFLKAQVIGTDPRNGVLKDAGLGHAHGGIIPGRPSGVDNVLIPMATGEGVATAKAMMNPANRVALASMNAGGRPYGAYSSSPSYSSAQTTTSIDNRQLVIPVTIQGAVVGDENHLASVVTKAVKVAIGNGAISRDWANR